MSSNKLSLIISDLLKKLGILVVITIFSATPSILFAQTKTDDDLNSENNVDSSESIQRLPEVVISASRTPVPENQIGTSVSVIDQEEIEQRQVKFVDELLREVPGLAVSQTGGRGGLTDIRIRGSESNHTLYIFEGIELNDPAPFSVFQPELLPTGLIDRVEVLRGAQSSLYGSESIGGVISMTTLPPPDGTEASAHIEMGSNETTELNVKFAHGTDSGHASFSHSRFGTDGFTKKDSEPDPDPYSNSSSLLKAGASLSDDLSFSVTGLLINAESDVDGFIKKHEYKKSFYKASAKYQPIDSFLSHTLSVTDTKHRRDDFNEDSKYGQVTGGLRKYEYEGEMSFPDSDNTLVFAIESESGDYDRNDQWATVKHKIQPSTSYIVELQSSLGDNLFLSLSGRHDDNSKNQFEDINTYRAAMAYLLGDGYSRIHSSIGTGIKNPNAVELYGYGESFVGNPNLLPETSKSWDIGYEFSPFSPDSSIDITYFRNDITNFIETIWGYTDSYQPIGAENESLVNRIRGLEISYRDVIADIYETTFALTKTKAHDADGNDLIRRPSTQLSLNINRPFTFSSYSGSINFNIQHTSKLIDTNFDVRPAVPVTLPSRTLFNIAGSFNTSENSQAIFRIENLFDKEDYQEVYGFNVPGRSAFVGMKFYFY